MNQVCVKCGIEKSLEDFPKRKAGKCGRRTECRLCRNSYERKYFLKNPEKRLARRERCRQYNQENGSSIAVRKSGYYEENAETLKSYRRSYCKKNRPKCNALMAKRKAALLTRTPKWSNLEKIAEIYQKCPKGHEVDHIIPLQGRIVSGFHVPENLQYLPVSLNRRKKNQFPFDVL